MRIPEWVLWGVGALLLWKLLPSVGRNMDGDTLVTWMGTRWLRKRYTGRWERMGNGWKK